MGQIVSSAAKPKRCNANQLSQVPTPAAGEHILVSSDNSMNAAGQGNFDCYIVGDGTTAATALELEKIDAEALDLLDVVINGGNIENTSTSFPNTGRYLSTTKALSNTGWYHTDLIPCAAGATINANVWDNSSTNTPVVIYYNSERVWIAEEHGTMGAQVALHTYTAPANTAYVRIQTLTRDGVYYTISSSLKGVKELADEISENTAEIAVLEGNIIKTKELFSPELFTIVGFAGINGGIRTNTGYHRTDYLSVVNIKSVSLYIRESAPASVSPLAWYREDKTFISAVQLPSSDPAWVEQEKPADAAYAILSTSDGYIPIVKGSAVLLETKENVFLSPTGADSNEGSESSPLATAFAARTYDAKSVVLLGGDYFDFNYSLDDFASMQGRNGARLINGTRISSATLSSGYTRVYEAAFSGSITTANVFLWQHDVADADTLISESEFMPLYHSGRTHRLSSTRIYKANSIAEIEQDTTHYRWYLTGGTLYFSAPSTDFAQHPIVIPNNDYYTAVNRRNVKLSDIKILYKGLNLYKLSGSLNNIFIGYTKGDAVWYDSNEYIELNGCEACASTNDGFGGSYTDNAPYSVLFRNCYGHDNADDGESGHVYSDITQFGGLYEYNGNGVTPASGAHGTYYNVICRNNGAHDWVSDTGGTAFSAQGGTSFSSIYCFGCISIGNTLGFRTTNTQGSMFVNCVSVNDTTPYSGGKQYNCATISE